MHDWLQKRTNYTSKMSRDEALGATIDSDQNASSETEALTIATETLC